MRKRILACVFVVALFAGGGSALAHVHPMVPADECAGTAGAGNTAAGVSDHTDWHPENGGFIPTANPGSADPQSNGNHSGVGIATANC